MYQCIAGNEEEESQAAAHLVLGGQFTSIFLGKKTQNWQWPNCMIVKHFDDADGICGTEREQYFDICKKDANLPNC